MKAITKLKDEARRHEQRGEWEKAIKVYLQVLAQADAAEGGEIELPLYNRVGDLCIRLGRQRDAVMYYEQAADRYSEAGLYNNAIALCNKALRYLPDRVELMRKLGQFSASQGFLTDARRYFLEYAEKKFGSGETDEALGALRDYANVAGDAEIRELLGRKLHMHSRTAEAMVELKRAYALRLGSGEPELAASLRREILSIEPSAFDDELAGGTVPVQPPAVVLPAAAARLPDLNDAPPPAAAEPVVEDPTEDPADRFRVESFADPGSDELEPEAGRGGTLVEGFETTGFGDLPPGGYDVSGMQGLKDLESSPEFNTDLGELPRVADLEGLGFGSELEEPEDQESGIEVSQLADLESTGFEPPPELGDTDFDSGIDLESTEFEPPVDLAESDFAGGIDLEIPEAVESGAELYPALADLDTEELPPDLDIPLLAGETDTDAHPLLGQLPLLEGTDSLDRVPVPGGDFGELGDLDAPEEFEPLPELELPETPEDAEPLPELPPLDAAPAGPGEPFVDLGALVAEAGPGAGDTRFTLGEQVPTGDEDDDFADLLSQFKQKVAQNVSPEDAAAHYDLGLAFKDMGLLDEAISELQVALHAGDMRLKVYEELGLCFFLKKEYSIAEKVLRRALETKYQDELELLGVYFHLGRAYEELGKRDAARDAYERVLALDINFGDVTERIARL